MTGRRSAGFIVVTVGFLWLTTALAAVAFWPVYRSWAFVLAVAVALVGATAVSVLGAVLRWQSPFVLLGTVAVFLIAGVPVAVPSKAQAGVLPTLEGLLDLITGVALGWRQLLTITLPVGDYQALLVPAFALVLVTTALGLGFALRTRVPEVGVLAPVVVFVVAVAFGPQVPERPVEVPIALLAGVLLWLAWLRWYRRRSAIRRLALQAGAPDAVRPDTGTAGLRTVLGA
ncbi:MAG TPA: transglutaminase domain-containing protein, partial [Rhodoglobus sp.]|nr:transglutaminase domain-containing protein [Rhodoglobus sp.]